MFQTTTGRPRLGEEHLKTVIMDITYAKYVAVDPFTKCDSHLFYDFLETGIGYRKLLTNELEEHNNDWFDSRRTAMVES